MGEPRWVPGGTAGSVSPDLDTLVREAKEALERMQTETVTMAGWEPRQSRAKAIRDTLYTLAQRVREAEEAKDAAMQALRLGGHLRGDGSICEYLAPGSVCNKCGHTDPAFGRIADLEANLSRYREVAEAVDNHYRASLDYQPPYVSLARRALNAESKEVSDG